MWPKLFAGLLLCSSCLLVRGAIVEAKEPQDESKDTDANTKSTLELVHVLFRHGPRTPVSTYPKDPYLNETYEPYGWGQLTNPAKVELYKIGKQLRKRYRDILSPYYQPDMIHAEATQSSRSIMSLQLVLAGLFPPENTPMEWSMLLNWQPIPIYTEPEATDKRLRQKAPCPRYDEAVWEVMHLPEVVELHEQNSKLLQELTNITGLNVSYTHDVTNVYISLQSQQVYGLKMPKWTRNYYPDKMRPLAVKSYTYDAYTTEMRKLKGGYYLEDVLKQMQSKVAGKLEPASRKMVISCAHDWTISNVLSALNVWQGQMPRFSALIAIELRRRKGSGDYFVEIYFQNDPSKAPQLLQVPGCSEQCPIAQFQELIKDVLPHAPYEQLCIAKGTSDGTRISYH
ncbi:lysosomal acid phosphatase [Drosophila grimshawi]|uniref:GH14399 n=1 Tax=Drosophila grimshawi TaxID=7222 RepID=B4J1A9_DROGR|nr:lysosomal acid phosphatase [Drosophila grimshawi]EDV97978.1 GH14399 [Drosophila grimshawi]